MIKFFVGLWKRWNIRDRIVPNKVSFEYSPIWLTITRKRCLEMCPRCCLMPWKDAKYVHHLKYKRGWLRIVLGYLFFGHDFGSSISGYEIPGWDIVPISEDGHQNSYGASRSRNSVHFTGDAGKSAYWLKHDHSIDNRNSFKMMWRLRLTFFLLIGGWVIFLFPPVAIACYMITSR